MSRSYYEILREELKPEIGYFIMHCSLPKELKEYLYMSLDNQPELRRSYNSTKGLNEQDWAKLKEILEVWDSPLMMALR